MYTHPLARMGILVQKKAHPRWEDGLSSYFIMPMQLTLRHLLFHHK